MSSIKNDEACRPHMDKNPAGLNSWTSLSPAVLFDADHAAWIKSLSRKQRAGEPAMQWGDLGPFVHTAYSLHCQIGAEYEYKPPVTLTDMCQPGGFYKTCVETRRKNIGLHHPFVPTPYERLSAFSQFIYIQMCKRLTSLVKKKGIDDGLGSALDDGLESSVVSDMQADDGLGFADVLTTTSDGLDDHPESGSDLCNEDDGLC